MEKETLITIFQNIAAECGGVLCQWTETYESPVVIIGENAVDVKHYLKNLRSFLWLTKLSEFAVGYFDKTYGYYKIIAKSRWCKISGNHIVFNTQEFTDKLKEINYLFKKNKVDIRKREMEGDFE